MGGEEKDNNNLVAGGTGLDDDDDEPVVKRVQIVDTNPKRGDTNRKREIRKISLTGVSDIDIGASPPGKSELEESSNDESPDETEDGKPMSDSMQIARELKKLLKKKSKNKTGDAVFETTSKHLVRPSIHDENPQGFPVITDAKDKAATAAMFAIDARHVSPYRSFLRFTGKQFDSDVDFRPSLSAVIPSKKLFERLHGERENRSESLTERIRRLKVEIPELISAIQSSKSRTVKPHATPAALVSDLNDKLSESLEQTSDSMQRFVMANPELQHVLYGQMEAPTSLFDPWRPYGYVPMETVRAQLDLAETTLNDPPAVVFDDVTSCQGISWSYFNQKCHSLMARLAAAEMQLGVGLVDEPATEGSAGDLKAEPKAVAAKEASTGDSKSEPKPEQQKANQPEETKASVDVSEVAQSATVADATVADTAVAAGNTTTTTVAAGDTTTTTVAAGDTTTTTGAAGGTTTTTGAAGDTTTTTGAAGDTTTTTVATPEEDAIDIQLPPPPYTVTGQLSELLDRLDFLTKDEKLRQLERRIQVLGTELEMLGGRGVPIEDIDPDTPDDWRPEKQISNLYNAVVGSRGLVKHLDDVMLSLRGVDTQFKPLVKLLLDLRRQETQQNRLMEITKANNETFIELQNSSKSQKEMVSARMHQITWSNQ